MGKRVEDVQTFHIAEVRSQFGWDKSSAGKHLDNRPSLCTTVLFDDLDHEASRDEQVRDWGKKVGGLEHLSTNVVHLS